MASNKYAKTIRTDSEEIYLLVTWLNTQYDIVVSDGRDCWEKQDVPCKAPTAYKHGDEQWRARVHEALCCPAEGCPVSFQFQANHIAGKRSLELSWVWQGEQQCARQVPRYSDAVACGGWHSYHAVYAAHPVHFTQPDPGGGAYDGVLKQVGSLRDKLDACQDQLATFEEQKRNWEEELVWQVAELLNKHNARIAELEEALEGAEEDRRNAELQEEAGTDDEGEGAGMSPRLEGDAAPPAGAAATPSGLQPAAPSTAMDVDVKVPEEEAEGGDGRAGTASAVPTYPSWLHAPDLMTAPTQLLPALEVPAASPSSASGPAAPAPLPQQQAAPGGKSQAAAAPAHSAVAALQAPAVKVRRRPIGGQR